MGSALPAESLMHDFSSGISRSRPEPTLHQLSHLGVPLLQPYELTLFQFPECAMFVPPLGVVVLADPLAPDLCMVGSLSSFSLMPRASPGLSDHPVSVAFLLFMHLSPNYNLWLNRFPGPCYFRLCGQLSVKLFIPHVPCENVSFHGAGTLCCSLL